MKLDELDESQGLTADMVREWLSAQNRSQLIGDVWTWRDGQLRDANLHHSLSFSLAALCAIGNKRPQQLLREINPRMRKGMPSKAALAAHDHWLVRDTETGELELHRVENGYLYSMSVYHGGVRTPDAKALPDFGSWMEFWPCDECGNKVRWPTDAQGNML